MGSLDGEGDGVDGAGAPAVVIATGRTAGDGGHRPGEPRRSVGVRVGPDQLDAGAGRNETPGLIRAGADELVTGPAGPDAVGVGHLEVVRPGSVRRAEGG